MEKQNESKHIRVRYRKNFFERGYLDANADVAAAVNAGSFDGQGLNHFKIFNQERKRKQITREAYDLLPYIRKEKLKHDIFLKQQHKCHSDNKYDFLTDKMRKQFGIINTTNVSSNSYPPEAIELIDRGDFILDCGSGFRSVYYDNVVNLEIADYITTDILSVGETLPFKDNTFDAVFSFAVLEHVKHPYQCAHEIARVLKPSGTLLFAAVFMQPYHGYPHHYLNMTPSGGRALIEDVLNIKSQTVPKWQHPVRSLPPIIIKMGKWIAGKYSGRVS